MEMFQSRQRLLAMKQLALASTTYSSLSVSTTKQTGSYFNDGPEDNMHEKVNHIEDEAKFFCQYPK